MASSYTYTDKYLSEIQKLFGQDILFVDLCGLFSSKATSLIENSEIVNLRKSIITKAKDYDGSAAVTQELNTLLEQFKNTATRVATSPNDPHYHAATQTLMKAIDTNLSHIEFDANYHDFIQSQNQIDRETMPVTRLIALRALARRKLFLSQTESVEPFEYKNYEIAALETVAARSLDKSVSELGKEISILSDDPKNDSCLDAKLANMTFESLYENLFDQYTNFLNSKTLHVTKSVSVLSDVAIQNRNTALSVLGVGVGIALLQSISSGPMLPFIPGGSWEASLAFIGQQLPWYFLGGAAAGGAGSIIYHNATNGFNKTLISNITNTNSLQKTKLLELAQAYKEKKIKLKDIVKDKEIANILGKTKSQQRRALARLALANKRAQEIINIPLSASQKADYRLQQEKKIIEKDNKVGIKSVDSTTRSNAIQALFTTFSKTNPLFVQLGVVEASEQKLKARKIVVKSETSTAKKAKSTTTTPSIRIKPQGVTLTPAYARLEEKISTSKASFATASEAFKEALKNKHLTSTSTTLIVDGQEVNITISKNQFAVSSQMFTAIMKDVQAYAQSAQNGESNFNYAQSTNKKNNIQVTVSKNKK